MSPSCAVVDGQGRPKFREAGGVTVRANNSFGNVAGEWLPDVAKVSLWYTEARPGASALAKPR